MTVVVIWSSKNKIKIELNWGSSTGAGDTNRLIREAVSGSGFGGVGITEHAVIHRVIYRVLFYHI